MVEKIALTVQEVAVAIGISDRRVWDLINVEGFPVVRLGKRVVIPVDGLRQWLAEQAERGEVVKL